MRKLETGKIHMNQRDKNSYLMRISWFFFFGVSLLRSHTTNSFSYQSFKHSSLTSFFSPLMSNGHLSCDCTPCRFNPAFVFGQQGRECIICHETSCAIVVYLFSNLENLSHSSTLFFFSFLQSWSFQLLLGRTGCAYSLYVFVFLSWRLFYLWEQSITFGIHPFVPCINWDKPSETKKPDDSLFHV